MAGRPSKLTEKQWNDIERRSKDGESNRALAKEYGINEAAVRNRINTQLKPQKELANQMAIVELAYEALPISTQVKVRNLTDELKDISQHLAGAARLGAMTSYKLANMANAQAEKINEDNPIESEDAMKSVSALNRMANDSSQIALSLLNANKDHVMKISNSDPKEVKTINDFYAENSNTKSSTS
jgi:hypothetical protein